MQRTTTKRNAVLALAGLLIGFGAGALTTHHVSAQGLPAALPSSPSGPRWQQHCEQAGSVGDASRLAAARGAEGFELVALYNGVMCFKRPLPTGVALPAAGPSALSAPSPSGAAPSWPGY